MLSFFIVFGAIYFASNSGFNENYFRGNSSANIVDGILECQKNRSESELTGCYAGYFSNYLAANTPLSLIKNFEQATRDSAEARMDCHQIAHAIGRASYVKLGRISDVFDLDREIQTCSGGVFHGAIEKMFRPDGDVPADEHISIAEFENKIPALCEKFSGINRKSECVHGVGHGALYVLGDLKEALAICKFFPKNSDHFSCYSGIFMEYELSGAGRQADSLNPLYPCDTTKEPYKSPCYYVLSFRMVNMGFDKEEIIAECGKAKNPGGSLCARGYGIFHLAHEALAEGFGPTITFCESLGRVNAKICAEAVASRLASLKESGEFSMPFCAGFSSDYLMRQCFSYSAGVLRIGHKIQPDHIKADCEKYLKNPEVCIDEI